CRNQLMRNIGPSKVCGARADAREELAAVNVQHKIGGPRLLKFRSPLVLELGLLRLSEQAGPPQGAALQVIAGMFEIAGVELLPRHRPATMTAPQPHDFGPVLLPRRLQLLPAVE